MVSIPGFPFKGGAARGLGPLFQNEDRKAG